MKKIIIGSLIGMTLLAGITPTVSVFAAEDSSNQIEVKENGQQEVHGKDNASSLKTFDQENNIITDLESVDPYIYVQNNQYVLNLPSNVTIPQEIKTQVDELVAASNSIIKDQKLFINPETKIARPLIQTYAAGKNAVEMHWNYARVYLNKKTVNSLVHATLSGGSTAVGGLLGGIGGATAGAFIGTFISNQIGSSPVSNGMWFDYNYIYRSINKWGFQ